MLPDLASLGTALSPSDRSKIRDRSSILARHLFAEWGDAFADAQAGALLDSLHIGEGGLPGEEESRVGWPAGGGSSTPFGGALYGPGPGGVGAYPMGHGYAGGGGAAAEWADDFAGPGALSQHSHSHSGFMRPAPPSHLLPFPGTSAWAEEFAHPLRARMGMQAGGVHSEAPLLPLGGLGGGGFVGAGGAPGPSAWADAYHAGNCGVDPAAAAYGDDWASEWERQAGGGWGRERPSPSLQNHRHQGAAFPATPFLHHEQRAPAPWGGGSVSSAGFSYGSGNGAGAVEGRQAPAEQWAAEFGGAAVG